MAVYSQQCTAVGSFAYASYFKLYVELSETYYDIGSNYSNVHYKIYAQSSGSGSINATHTKYATVNGTEVVNWTGNVNVRSPNAYIGLAEGNIDYIYHENDGTKSIPFYAKIQGSTYGIYAEFSGWFTLTTIPRASDVSSTSANIGEGITITINKASSGFTHTISYSFGSLSGTIATKTSNSSVGFTLPSTFYAQIPNAKSGNGTITCQTYNGNSLLGTKTCSFTAYAKEADCTPDLSATAVDVNSATIALSGSSAKLINSLSTARVTITTSAKNSATITSKVVNNTTVSGTTIDFENVTVNVFTITVTDSRGFTNTVTKTLTMVNYVPLTVSANFKRTAPTTGEVQVTYSGNYFNGNFGATNNTLAVKWYYKLTDANTWTTGGTLNPTVPQSGNTYSNGQNPTSLGSIFDYTKEYDFKLTVDDKLSSLEYTTRVPKGKPVFNWGEDFFHVNGDISAEDVSASGNVGVTGNINITGNIYKDNKNILQRHVITLAKSSQQTITANQAMTPVRMDNQWNKVGDKLSFESSTYSVKIGAGVNYVIASGTCWVEVSGGYKWCQILRKRGSSVICYNTTITPRNGYENWDCISMAPVLIDVQQNDIIYMAVAVTNNTGYVQAGTYGKQSTYLTVEAVG